MEATVVSLPGNERFANRLAESLDAVHSAATVHRFPDGECRIRIEPEQDYGTTVVVATLSNPDPTVVPLLFLNRTLCDHGAQRIILAAPYLAYMRQDTRFNPGEGVSARYFGALVSGYFDALVTVDPHLHRIASLDEVYSIPAAVVHAAPQLAQWVQENTSMPLLIGPDSESVQWVREVASRVDAPFTVLEKIRRGDKDVEVSIPDAQRWRDREPVLIDDVIASGGTMLQAVRSLLTAGLTAPICIGVHGIFADDAYARLKEAGSGNIVTTNTLVHPSNAIDMSAALAESIRRIVRE